MFKMVLKVGSKLCSKRITKEQSPVFFMLKKIKQMCLRAYPVEANKGNNDS